MSIKMLSKKEYNLAIFLSAVIALAAVLFILNFVHAHNAPLGKVTDRYPSSTENGLVLSADFYIPEKPRPLLLFLHGWHGNAGDFLAENFPHEKLHKSYFIVAPNMRGRNGDPGNPDASGFELLDAIDAVKYACKKWSAYIDKNKAICVLGGSGGGGNALTLAGKAPDMFGAVVSINGISDYADWFYINGSPPEAFQDEMLIWIGGSPLDNPWGYFSRSGIYLLPNVITNVLLIHAKDDGAVPAWHSQRYYFWSVVEKARFHRQHNVQLVLIKGKHNSYNFNPIFKFLAHAKNDLHLPRKGTLLVHSFIVTKNFDIILDSASGAGSAYYELDNEGRLITLVMTKEYPANLESSFRIILQKSVSIVMAKADNHPEEKKATGGQTIFEFKYEKNIVLRFTYS